MEYNLKNSQLFPDSFRAKFSEFGENFDIKFIKSANLKGSDNVFVMLNGQPTKFNFTSEDLYEIYHQQNGDGWATLARYIYSTSKLKFVSQNFF